MLRITLAAAIAVAFSFTALAGAAPNYVIDDDKTPATCDSKTLAFHVHRARSLIDVGYDLDRIPDATPMRGSEKRALRGHKFCVDPPHRDRISRYRARLANKYRDELYERAPWLTKRARRLVASLSGTLAAIRSCESSGDYTAVDDSGTYYGAYQFDSSTWASVGGSGSPAAASPAEQDYRAAVLYQRSGADPWPVCGV
jgi:hypothetical protein